MNFSQSVSVIYTKLSSSDPSVREEGFAAIGDLLRQVAHDYVQRYPTLMATMESVDLLQEIHLALIKRLYPGSKDLESEANLHSCLTKITRWMANDQLRTQLGANGYAAKHSGEVPAEAIAQQSSAGTRIDRKTYGLIVAGLPEHLREVALPHLFERKNLREIADELGLPHATVKTRWGNAKKILSIRLKALAPEPVRAATATNQVEGP